MKYYRETPILNKVKETLNELESKGYKILSVYQYQDSLECNVCSIIYRDKYWFEKFFSLTNQELKINL